MNKKRKLQILLCIVFVLIILVTNLYQKHSIESKKIEAPVNLVKYTGKIYHIFFHSLIIYPKLAFHNNDNIQGFKDYMITKSEFEKMLPKIYKNNFVLIDARSLYQTNPDGSITKKDLYIPEGKKPLILSIDDVNYQRDRDHRGFAKRVVLDKKGEIATEVITPEGKTIVTRDGDVMPILDDFVKANPDFSHNGAKGIIAETGFDGVLGYRTNIKEYPERKKDLETLEKVVKKFKETGWIFASHSYSHDPIFKDGEISIQALKWDTDLWEKEVAPIVGPTDIFVGPFGQTFSDGDERRNYLLSKGFKALYGVGMDLHLEYFPNYMFMNRADIDGIRLVNSPYYLTEYFDPTDVVDPERFID